MRSPVSLVPRRLLAVALVGLLALAPGLGLAPPAPAATTAAPDADCDPAHHLLHAAWSICWRQHDLRAQGIELYDVRFRGVPVVGLIGFPFTLTEYASADHGPYKDVLGVTVRNPGNGFGAMTLTESECPRFTGNGALHNVGRLCVETRVGPEPMLVLWARYDLLDYRFLQGYMLDSRGVLEPFVRLGGRLVDGDLGEAARDHIHHLYWRIDLDVASAGGDGFERRGPAPLRDLDRGLCALGTPGSLPGWDRIDDECALRASDGKTRWRVVDPHDRNAHGHARSFELDVRSDTGPDAFSTFDVLLLQDQGPDAEIGYEVPAVPLGGDNPLAAYAVPPEPIKDPVVWVAQHVHHDPRDEDRGSMTYHEARIQLRPRDLFDQNPGEDTYRR